MRYLHFVLLILVLPSLGRAQLKIENPRNLDVPVERAQVIFSTGCRVVAEEFHIKPKELAHFPLILVLGTPADLYEDDHDSGSYKIHLQTWNEKKFAIGVMRLAVEMLVTRERRDRLVSEILTRANSIAPLDVSNAKTQPEKGQSKTGPAQPKSAFTPEVH